LSVEIEKIPQQIDFWECLLTVPEEGGFEKGKHGYFGEMTLESTTGELTRGFALQNGRPRMGRLVDKRIVVNAMTSGIENLVFGGWSLQILKYSYERRIAVKMGYYIYCKALI
jgi:hypothetical protein